MMLAELFSEIFIHFIINVSILQLHDGGSSEPALWVHRWSFIVSDAKCRAFGFEWFCPLGAGTGSATMRGAGPAPPTDRIRR